jgi:HAD superfamily hydrolase (TIGR01509 family)
VPAIEGVLFDLDGVLIDSEPIWERVRGAFAQQHGGQWSGEIQTRMMGVSTAEWSSALSELVGGQVSPDAAAAAVIESLVATYRRQLPVIDGAVAAVRGLAPRFRLGLVSGSPPPLIALTLELMGLASSFDVAISADDVGRGKPYPDPYVELARRMRLEPALCVAVEDSGNGLRSALAAGARVIAIPRGDHRPDAGTLRLASVVLRSIRDLTPELLLELRN